MANGSLILLLLWEHLLFIIKFSNYFIRNRRNVDIKDTIMLEEDSLFCEVSVLKVERRLVNQVNDLGVLVRSRHLLIGCDSLVPL